MSEAGQANFNSNISASGDVYADAYYSEGQAVINYVPGQDRIQIGNKPTYIQGNITASGNISSSGLFEGDRKFKVPAATRGNTGGADVVFFGNTVEGAATVAGAIYVFNSSGEWVNADASAASTATGLLAVARGTAAADGFVARGMVTLVADPGSIGDILYLATAPQRAQSTAPTGTGQIVRVIGYCVDSSNAQIYFNPDNTWVELS